MAEKPARGQIYRRATAAASLLTGSLSLGLAAGMLRWQRAGEQRNINAGVFLFAWLFVFLLAGLLHLGWLTGSARRHGDAMFATNARRAYATTWPSLFTGVAICACLEATSGLPLFSALFLVIFYGLGLLSLRHLAWKAVNHLGWAFLLTGLAAFIYLMNETVLPEMDLPMPTNLWPAAIMGGTFGLYHLVFALCTWPRALTRG